MLLKTEGLIIKEQTVGESDRLVTVLTRDAGVLRAFARRAKQMKDSKNSATQLLCYSRLNIHKGRDKYIINDAFPLEVFFGLRSDVEKLALAQYFCELAAELIPEDTESESFLRLILNALYFISRDMKKPEMIKPVVEMRILSDAGFMPDLVGCRKCGRYEHDRMYFLPGYGRLYCGDCYEGTGALAFLLERGAVTAMRHIIYSDFDKLFSFNLSAEALVQLTAAAEAYMLAVLQKRLKTLDFYNSIKNV